MIVARGFPEPRLDTHTARAAGRAGAALCGRDHERLRRDVLLRGPRARRSDRWAIAAYIRALTAVAGRAGRERARGAREKLP